jgi:hypothetical protein
VQEHKVGVANALLNDGKDVVITAETKELQKFIGDHAGDDTLFTEHTTEMQKRP